MATIKNIEGITFKAAREPELIAKLNAVASKLCRNGHDAARFLLNKILDQQIQELNIQINISKPAQSAGAD